MTLYYVAFAQGQGAPGVGVIIDAPTEADAITMSAETWRGSKAITELPSDADVPSEYVGRALLLRELQAISELITRTGRYESTLAKVRTNPDGDVDVVERIEPSN